MGASEQWPPLEIVREWAEYRLATGHPEPDATSKYRNLITLIDEILAAQAQGNTREESAPEDRQGV